MATAKAPAVLLGTLVAATLAVAVFLMHGPSSGHMLFMAGGHAGGDHTVAQMTMPDDAATSPSDLPAASPAPLAMTHSDCLATLRADDGRPLASAHVVLVGAPRSVVPASGSTPSTAAMNRAPPDAPDLTRLCISRT